MSAADLESKLAFSKRICVTPQFVTKLAQQGRIVLVGEGRTAKVHIKKSLELYEATAGDRADVTARHARERAAKKKAAPKKKSAAKKAPGKNKYTSVGGNESAELVEMRQRKVNSETRRITALADKEELELQEMLGNHLLREDVDYVLQEFGAMFRAMAGNMADRLAPIVAPIENIDEAHAAIDEYAIGMENEMADALKKKARREKR